MLSITLAILRTAAQVASVAGRGLASAGRLAARAGRGAARQVSRRGGFRDRHDPYGEESLNYAPAGGFYVGRGYPRLQIAGGITEDQYACIGRPAMKRAYERTLGRIMRDRRMITLLGSYVPEIYGRLRSSARITVVGNDVIPRFDAPYAGFVKFDHKQLGRRERYRTARRKPGKQGIDTCKDAAIKFSQHPELEQVRKQAMRRAFFKVCSD